MGNREIDLTESNAGLPEEAGRVVRQLEVTAGQMTELPFVGIHSVTGRPGDIDNALAGSFRLKDEHFRLEPPIDWWDEPYRAAGERGFFQNSFLFADPLLSDPRFPEVLVPLVAIITDWLSTNPRAGAAHPHRYAWHDHAAAGRLVVIAFVLREGLCRDLLSARSAKTLAAGVLEHVSYLAADENHAPNNHGLFSDAAIAVAARDLAPLQDARQWAEAAEQRFVSVLDHSLSRDEAMHLEHSPYYHWIIYGALSRFASIGLFEGLDLVGLTQRMIESGAWLVAPDGTLPPIGDTPIGERPPAEALSAGEGLEGKKVFSAAGYAVVRKGNSALFVTAGHHATAHKHADDGSFCLYERGQPLILDSGDPGYEYESPEFRYGTSPEAHATICVDQYDWGKETPPYGSGVVDSAAINNLFGFLTYNPKVVRDGGAARRVLVYWPGRFLIAIDDVEADPTHELVRTLPLAADLDATLAPGNVVEIMRGASTAASLIPVSTPHGSPTHIELSRGQYSPAMRGFCFRSPDSIEPRYDVRLCSEAGHPCAFALLLDETVDAEPRMDWRRVGTEVDVSISGLTASPIEVHLSKDSLAFESVH